MNQIPSVNFYVPGLSEAFDESIFSDLMVQDDSEVLNWALNVTQKAYEKGMVNAYITRNLTENINDDDDFIDFWSAISIVFSYIVRYTRQIGLENPTQEIFFKYLEQKNLFNCPNQDLLQLSYLAENYYNEIRKRGTNQIYKRKSGSTLVDGEAMRILCYSFELKDEFIFILQEPFKTGWVVNQCSPLYMGLEGLEMASKRYENQIEDLAKYPKAGTPTIAVDNGENVIQLDSGDGISGVGSDFDILFNSTLPYEISFLVKGNGGLSFGALGSDKNGGSLNFRDVATGGDSNLFFESHILQQTTEFYLVKGIIFPYNFVNFPAQLIPTNLNIGNNLLSKRNHRSLIPQIICTSGQILIKSLKINVAFLEWNSSFVHPANFINLVAVNRNDNLSPNQIYEGIRNYMLPYDSILAVKLLGNLDEAEQSVELDLTDILLNRQNQGLISGTNLLLYTI